MQRRSGGYYFLCKPITKIFDEKQHGDADYLSKSAMRTSVSTSRQQGEAVWAVASHDVGLGVEV